MIFFRKIVKVFGVDSNDKLFEPKILYRPPNGHMGPWLGTTVVNTNVRTEKGNKLDRRITIETEIKKEKMVNVRSKET